ncbi:MAG: fumarate hydratase [Acetobacter sp.]|nr:fumarate hydratase [Acetobacter sp.]
MTPSFTYSPLFPLGQDTTTYRKLDIPGVSTSVCHGHTIVHITSDALTKLTAKAFHEVSHFLRASHLEKLALILNDPEASDNDRFVAFDMLKNACISAGEVLPMCQDTGTAIIFGKKGQHIWVEGNEEIAFFKGVYDTYTYTNLRYSQMAPLTRFEEKNTATNLPVQCDILASPAGVHDEELSLMFVAKGGGSANKTFLFQETRALLGSEEHLLAWLDTKIRTLGTAACPPYHLAIVIGGMSAEQTLKTVKLASTHWYDALPTSGDMTAHAFRDLDMEHKVLDLTRKLGIGAQFGGKYFCHDVRVLRLPRHGASLPVGIGVSCSADRQIKARITAEGIFLEQLEHDPARFLPEITDEHLGGEAVHIDLSRPMDDIRKELSKYPVKTRLSLTGTLIVARDIAHAKFRERLQRGEGLPQYLKDHPIYYAGPAKTPKGMPTGSFGPTTAGRMDTYVDELQAHGGSYVMLAKGNRSKVVRDACQKHGGFYLGSIGGPAARLAKDCIRHVQVLEYPELGMEAVWKIEVENFPAFIVIDDKGNDFFAEL